MQPSPRILAIHDLSGFGHTSLLAVIPIMYRMGIEVAALPSALLSTNTDYPDYHMQDNTHLMAEHLEHWSAMKQSFDAIYTGFLGSPEQVDLLLGHLEGFKKANTLVLVDPVMGDAGKLYSCYNLSMVKAMRDLLAISDIITPNYSEAALLLDCNFRENPGEDELHNRCRQLAALGPRHVVITSVPISPDTQIWIALYDKTTDAMRLLSCPKIRVNFPGTGDCFASLLLGGVLNGYTVEASVRGAMDYLCFAIEQSVNLVAETRDGIALATALATNPLGYFSKL